MEDGDRHSNVAHRPNSPSIGGDVQDLNTTNQHFKRDSLDVDGSVHSSNAQSSPPRPPTPTSTAGVGGGGDGYDPKRIPSGVFTSKSGNGIDWSTTSNESLFSIYMGNNNSFSRDQIAMLQKSGELPLLDHDLSSNVPPAPAASGLMTWQPPLPPSSPAASPTVGLNRNSTASSSTTTNRNSTSSTNSFQFPILQQEQSGRNSTRIIEAEQNKLPEALLEEEEEEEEEEEVVVEEQTTTTTQEHKKNVTEEDEEKDGEKEEQKQDQETPEQTVENEEKTTSEESTKGGGRSSNWLSCFPCFSKSAASSS